MAFNHESDTVTDGETGTAIFKDELSRDAWDFGSVERVKVFSSLHQCSGQQGRRRVMLGGGGHFWAWRGWADLKEDWLRYKVMISDYLVNTGSDEQKTRRPADRGAGFEIRVWRDRAGAVRIRRGR